MPLKWPTAKISSSAKYQKIRNIKEESHFQNHTKAMKTEKDNSDLVPYTSNPAKSKLICGICKENKPLSDLLFLNRCSHCFCSRCVGCYVSSKVAENMAVISCPIPECKNGTFDPLLCKPMIAREVFDHWCMSLCVFVIKNKFYCPFMDCFALLTDERGNQEVIREAECPHCHRLFCAECKSTWHAGMTCENFHKLGKN
ncbi:probable E3 ubiquitin-protein ligase RNF144A-B [Dendrobium catenatum]|nr:probable E3 ubiquitin-protein ligase RNF144A-B [Dendrobium catenatum]